MARNQRTTLDVRLTATDRASDQIEEVTSSYADLLDEIEEVADSASEIDDSGIRDIADAADEGSSSVGRFSGILGKLGEGLKSAFSAGLDAIKNVGAQVFSLYGDLNESQRKIKTSLNLTNEEAREMRGIVGDVWTEGFGEVGDITDTLIYLRQNIKGLSNEDLTHLTDSVTVLTTTFEQDLEKMTGATGALMNEFGLTAQETMDFLAAGFTRGLDSAGDFLDTVNEYSNIFQDAGFSASQFFGILEAGQKTGVLGTDKIADTVKEGYLRFMSGSDTYADALVEARLEAERGQGAYYNLGKSLTTATNEMDLAEAKTSEWEEKLASATSNASELKSKLDEANRTLKDMARPNLKGAEAYDNKLFDLEQQAKKLQLAMLDIPKDSPAYERLQEQLDGVNNQMQKISLQRDIDLEPKYRALEKSVEAVEINPEISFEEAANNINEQKKVVHKLSGAYIEASKDVETASANVEHWSTKYGASAAEVERLKKEFTSLRQPVFDMIQDVRDGKKTYAEVLPQIIEWIEGVEDPITRAAIAAEVFGTPIEDLGTDAGLAAMKTGLLQTSMDDLNGTMAETKDNATTGMGVVKSKWMDFVLFLQDILDNVVQTILKPFGEEAAGIFLDAFGGGNGNSTASVDEITAKIEQGLRPALDYILGILPSVTDFIKNLMSSGGDNTLTQTITSVKEATAALSIAMDKASSPKFQNTMNAAAESMSAFSGIAQNVSDMLSGETSGKLDTAMRAFDMLKVILHTVGNAFRIIKEIVSAVLSVITVVIAIVANLIAVLNGSITPMDAFKNIGSAIADIFVHLGNAIGTAIDTVWELVSAFGAVEPPEWLSNLGGTLAGKIGIPGFAEGGNFGANNPMIVGEEGPELMVPKRSGTVIPTPILAGMGGNTVNITIQGSADQATVAQIERAINRSLNNMVKQKVF